MNLRFRLHVTGIVQGVGFRPFVYRLAHECQLTGFVVNNSRGVFIEVQGSPESLADFTSRLQSDAPPLARIKHVTQDRISSSDETAFRIKESERESGEVTMVPPDISVCEDCLRELTDAADPRFNYALINCTNCGPRFTIITDLPYDRPYTTMAGYPLCPDCRREYLHTTVVFMRNQPLVQFVDRKYGWIICLAWKRLLQPAGLWPMAKFWP